MAENPEAAGDLRTGDDGRRTGVHRLSGISLKMAPAAMPTAEPRQERPPLTQESLEECWRSMLGVMEDKEPKLAATLKDRVIRLEWEDFFVVEVGNSFVEAEIRPHLREMLEEMRRTSGRRLLNCKVEVVYEEREAVIYAPRDKYDAMSKNNPVLDTFRILFPEVDL